ncbi:MAG: hypothetical protein HY692_04510 [Cyanobacteria bacterium NC_groundwater_1444_Ag_S-0.65um_54_12]|nr:hypothetical protein [Cyanobacteria bacterium NC_groundwater_1444_Ag_S-0.65um_54_12]
MKQAPVLIDAEYDAGLKLYENGAPLEVVLQHFDALRQLAPGDVRLSISLSWLHILLGNRERAIAHAREAKHTPQGRFNLALAYLVFGEKGVRDHFAAAIANGGQEGIADAMANLEDAIARKGGSFPPAEKMLQWLYDFQPENTRETSVSAFHCADFK